MRACAIMGNRQMDFDFGFDFGSCFFFFACFLLSYMTLFHQKHPPPLSSLVGLALHLLSHLIFSCLVSPFLPLSNIHNQHSIRYCYWAVGMFADGANIQPRLCTSYLSLPFPSPRCCGILGPRQISFFNHICTCCRTSIHDMRNTVPRSRLAVLQVETSPTLSAWHLTTYFSAQFWSFRSSLVHRITRIYRVP